MSRATPASGGRHDQGLPDAPLRPPDERLRPPAGELREPRRPAARDRRRGDPPLGVAVPLRTCSPRRRHDYGARRVGAPCDTPALVAGDRPALGRGSGRPGHRRPPYRPASARRTPLRGHHHSRGRRVACRRNHPRPVELSASPGPADRWRAIGRALVEAPATPRQGPHGTDTRHLAPDSPGRWPGQVAGPVSGGRCVGLASTLRPGTRRVRAWHIPGNCPRRPHARRPGQPIRATGARQGPAHGRDHLARPVRLVHH